LHVLDIATGKIIVVADLPLNGELQGYCWSPNGKQIAYTWREKHDGKPEDLINKETESHLVVCDPDGKNHKTIASEKGRGQWTITIGHVDWR
jgi:Tol biopolymer transport system component